MLNGLDLFSGIGGISLALREWVRPIAYCEIDAYCQGVLLSRMGTKELRYAPIWDDIRTLSQYDLPRCIDIIYGGFPCQDISIAGHGKGLEGERSSLCYEIFRLVNEIKPRWIFLENVPTITTRGGIEVVKEIAKMGYDCRWITITASSVGALHKRERWFLLANTKRSRLERHIQPGQQEISESRDQSVKHDGYPNSQPSRQTHTSTQSLESKRGARGRSTRQYWPFESKEHWQETVSSMGKCSYGIPFHVDRLKSLGNSVVPVQAREAFKVLMGLK